MTKVSTQPIKIFSKFIKDHCSEDVYAIWNDEFKEELSKIIENEAKKNPKKAKKSADAPKGARSAYILWCMDDRSKVDKEFPEATNQEKVSIMAQRWKKAKENPKILEEYTRKAEKDKERAALEKENYIPSESAVKDEGEDESTEKKKVKRTKTGYQLYCQDTREAVKGDGYSGKEITEELNKRWKTLQKENEEVYKEYMQQASELKNRGEDDTKKDIKPTKTKKTVAKKKVTTKKHVDEDDDEDLLEEE
jgi:hypothetical protein